MHMLSAAFTLRGDTLVDPKTQFKKTWDAVYIKTAILLNLCSILYKKKIFNVVIYIVTMSLTPATHGVRRTTAPQLLLKS